MKNAGKTKEKTAKGRNETDVEEVISSQKGLGGCGWWRKRVRATRRRISIH